MKYFGMDIEGENTCSGLSQYETLTLSEGWDPAFSLRFILHHKSSTTNTLQWGPLQITTCVRKHTNTMNWFNSQICQKMVHLFFLSQQGETSLFQ